MKIHWQGNVLSLDFSPEEMESIRESFTVAPPREGGFSRAVITDQRAAQMEQERAKNRKLLQNQKEAEAKLQSGVFPFKAQRLGIELKNSPRTEAQKTGQFAGESQMTQPEKPKPSSPTSDNDSTRTAKSRKPLPTSNTSET